MSRKTMIRYEKAKRRSEFWNTYGQCVYFCSAIASLTVTGLLLNRFGSGAVLLGMIVSLVTPLIVVFTMCVIRERQYVAAGIDEITGTPPRTSEESGEIQ